jgi:lysophospholipase L1-like esterase
MDDAKKQIQSVSGQPHNPPGGQAASGRLQAKMNSPKWPRLALILIVASWFLLGHWLAIPVNCWVALGCLGGVLLLAASWPSVAASLGAMGAGWMLSLAVPASFCFGTRQSYVLDLAYAWLAWLVAAAVLALSLCLGHRATRRRWQRLSMVWSFAGGGIWLASCYLQNDRPGFHFAILTLLGLLILCKAAFHLPNLGVQAANTWILLLVTLPVADFFVRPRYEFRAQIDDPRKFYSYEAARRDPEAFAAWWQVYCEQYHTLMEEIGANGPKQHASVLPPNSHATFLRCPLRINNKGFRGADIPDVKGDTYRIVALGESTTFGATLLPGDKPWPEILEDMIRERLKPRRPVQVINAGIPALTLRDNLRRLPIEILPLKPDMIISYHGVNGFSMLNSAIPPLGAPKAPAFQPRPLKLLANAEYGIKVRLFRRSLASRAAPSGAASAAPLESDYAQAYRQLIGVARTNQIRVVLANFSMAVNPQSKADVVAFYRAGFPSVYWQIQANLMHSLLIRGVAEEAPDVLFVDTQRNLDGDHSKFIDLIHFTQEGRVQLADNIFDGIKDILQRDLD